MESSRRCNICTLDVHRASYAKHLRIKKRLENIRQDDTVIKEWFIKEERTPIKREIKKVCNSKTSKQIARDKNNLDDIELDEELA